MLIPLKRKNIKTEALYAPQKYPINRAETIIKTIS